MWGSEEKKRGSKKRRTCKKVWSRPATSLEPREGRRETLPVNHEGCFPRRPASKRGGREKQSGGGGGSSKEN